MRRSAGAQAAVRGRQRHADPLQGPAQTQGSRTRPLRSPSDQRCAKRGSLGSPPWGHNARYAAGRNRVRAGLNNRSHETGGRIELPQGATPEGGSRRRRKLQRLIPSRPAPSLPHQVPNEHAKNAGARRHRHLEEASASTHWRTQSTEGGCLPPLIEALDLYSDHAPSRVAGHTPENVLPAVSSASTRNSLAALGL